MRRLEQGGGPIPVVFLDVGAAEQPRGLGVRPAGKEVCEDLPGVRGPAGPEQRSGQQHPERAHRSGSGGLSLGIELEEPAERPRRPGGIVQLGPGRPEHQADRGLPTPAVEPAARPTSSAAFSRSSWR